MSADKILFSTNTVVTYNNKDYQYNAGTEVNEYSGKDKDLQNISKKIKEYMSRDHNEKDLTYDDFTYAKKLVGQYGIKAVRKHADAGIVTFDFGNNKILKFDFETEVEKNNPKYQNLKKEKESHLYKMNEYKDKYEDSFDVRLIQNGDKFVYEITLKNNQTPLEIGKAFGWSANYMRDNNDLFFKFFNETEIEDLSVEDTSDYPQLDKTINKGHKFTVPANATFNYPKGVFEQILGWFFE